MSNVLDNNINNREHTKPSAPLNIKVETVKDDIAKGTRETLTSPLRGDWAKGAPDPISKVISRAFAFNVLTCGRSTSSQRQKDLLSGTLADRDVFHNLMAIGEKTTCLVSIHIKGPITLVTKVGLGPSGLADVRENIDKAKVYNIQRGLRTKRAQARLVCTLTLNLLVSILLW